MPKKRPGSAARRAYKSMPKAARQGIKKAAGIKGKATKAQRTAIGKGVRKTRLARGDNPNTGRKASAKQLGLKGNAKKVYRAQDSTGKRGMVKGMAKSGLKKTGTAANKTYNKPSMGGGSKKTRTVSRIAKRKGISRSAANKVRKAKKK